MDPVRKIMLEISGMTGMEIQSQNMGINRQLSMELISLDYYATTNKRRENIPKAEFHSYISDDNEKYDCNSHAHMVHLFNNFIYFEVLVSEISTVWEGTYGCAK